MDHFEAISIFIAVAEEGGFTSAAKRLRISPASVTRAVSQLEDRLKIRLFNRSTRSVQLTDAGIRFFADCQRIIPELEEAEQFAAGIYQAPRGKVTVTASVLCGRMIVAPILLDLLDEYPGLSLSTVYVDRVVHLIDEGIDLAVRFGDLPSSSLVSVRVGETRRVLCAAPAYLLQFGRPTILSDLRSHTLIDLDSMKHNGRWNFNKDKKHLSFKPSSRLQVNSADAAIAAALNGYGITRVASYMAASALRAGQLEIVLDDFEPPPVPAHVVRKEMGRASGRVRAAFDYLVDRLKSDPQLAPFE